MNCVSETNIFKFPISSSECTRDIYDIEKNAVKALDNINLIYKEIMTPKEYIPEESEIFGDKNLGENNKDAVYFCSQQNHYLKACCNTLKELCVNCDRLITQCSSCRQCKCSVLNNNINKVENYESSENIHSVIRPNSAPIKDYKAKCTVPNPFSFNAKDEEWQKTKQYKISKLKQEIEDKIENELKIRAGYKPVPKNTHLPLYNKMVEEQKKHKVKRKEKCIESLNSTKPFNLQVSKSAIKGKSSTDLTSENISNFKAKPVPKNILSDKVSEKLKTKEEVRKMLMVERAKETREQSSLPFSQRPITYSRSLIDLLNLDKAHDKRETKPKNITEITNRLYMKKCNETMNNWNEKVLLVDTGKKITNQEKQDLLINKSMHKKQLMKEELPFMYFPVRMSNAAILREKQIR